MTGNQAPEFPPLGYRWQAGLVRNSSRPALAVPPAVASLAGGRPCQLVWENETGGLTFEIGSGWDRSFVKWAPAGSAAFLRAEAARLSWAEHYTPVPRVLGWGRDGSGSWLVTAAMPGDNAVADRWTADPRTAVRAIGEGLRALHDALPVASCPFSWSAEERLADAQRRAGEGSIARGSWHEDHEHLSLDAALALLADIPPADQLVVCHGDSCAPNTLIADNGRWSAHVDLGELGVADRWADLAIATWSTSWNYGPGWERSLLDAYGIDPDPDRTRYYRLLWELGP
jgi:kanamycin kinase